MAISPCVNTPIVTGIVSLVPADFRAAFPEFTGLTDPQLLMAFSLATLFLNNSCCGVVFNATLRESLLNLLTAHIAFLNYGSNDGAGNVTPAPGIVGRVNTATEGTVSVGAEMIATANSSFYLQTKYGAMYWTATARFRTMRYVAPVVTCDTPWGEGVPGFFGGGPGCGC